MEVLGSAAAAIAWGWAASSLVRSSASSHPPGLRGAGPGRVLVVPAVLSAAAASVPVSGWLAGRQAAIVVPVALVSGAAGERGWCGWLQRRERRRQGGPG